MLLKGSWKTIMPLLDKLLAMIDFEGSRARCHRPLAKIALRDMVTSIDNTA